MKTVYLYTYDDGFFHHFRKRRYQPDGTFFSVWLAVPKNSVAVRDEQLT